MIPPIQLGISVGITGLQVPDNEGNGGEGGIRTRPFFELSCYQGDGENPYKHSHSNTISFPSYLSNVAPFNYISAFLELMELMRAFRSRRSYLRSLAKRHRKDGHNA